MTWNITEESLFSAGALAFILAGLFCAYVRWNHMCRPFSDIDDYFYPARKLVTLFFASIVLTFPYVLEPMDSAVWTYTRAFGVLYYPVCFAVSISQYFKLHGHRKSSTLRKIYPLTPLVLIMAMLASILLGRKEWMVAHERTVIFAVGTISVILTAITVNVLTRLRKEIERFNTDNYSDEEDFPYKFASKMFITPMLFIITTWVVFISGSRWINFTMDILASFWMIHFLCIILHPQRVLLPDGTEGGAERNEEREGPETREIEGQKADEAETEACPPDDDGTPADEIKAEVLAIVLRRFRDPHLLKTEVLADIGTGKMNKASKFISQVGYYNLVNMFRLEYARLYKDAHPNAKQEEIATASGFASRTSYYKAKRNVGKINHEFTGEIRLIPDGQSRGADLRQDRSAKG